MNTRYAIGERLQQFRNSQGWTIQTLAQQTGLSTATLSQLERNLGNPTLSVLETLAQTLGISLANLLSGDIPNQNLVCRKADWNKIQTPGDAPIYHMVSTAPVRSRMELLHLKLPPQTPSNATWSTHPHSEEIAFVRAGSCEIHFPGEVIALQTGDSIRILPQRKHLFFNPHPAPCLLLFAKETR